MVALSNKAPGGGSGLTPQQSQSMSDMASSLEETKRILNDLKYVYCMWYTLIWRNLYRSLQIRRCYSPKAKAGRVLTSAFFSFSEVSSALKEMGLQLKIWKNIYATW